MTLLELAVVALSVALLVGGVVGSVLPVLPGGLLSAAGVLVYWWHTGFADPSTPVAVGLLVVALVALVVDWLAGAVSAKVGGARTSTAVLAAVVGFLLLFVAGPLGLLLGTVGTVFAVEYYRDRNARRGARTALVTAIGMLGSTAVQVVLTTGVLVAMLATILV